ncbi:MAG: Uma2 family endonuclease [Cyanobacteria bacterium]|nr:Uma2 family endonuclease [Cyanobacteria bacterium GSL.Bin21]
MTQLTQRVYTPEEYLEFEAKAEVRHEFINGEVVPMAGGTTKHNVITGNIYIALRLALKDRNAPVYMENVKLWIPSVNIFTYPDVMVLAGDPVYYGEGQTTVTNPVVIIEVLSDSTRNYDQGEKFSFDRTFKTLQEYVLVDPDKSVVMVYRRGTAKEWSLHILDDSTDVLQLETVGVEVPLSVIYEGI